MKIDIKPKMALHNEFDIHVRNVETGEVKKYKAYNIVLNQCLTRSLSWADSLTQIHVGDGTGTLDVTRTSLFNLVRRRAITNIARTWDIETYTFTREGKIVLSTTENVGVTFTEIGLGYSSNAGLTTHAFIEDSEGNPITIGPKLDTEEITFYATYYMKLLNDGVDGFYYSGTHSDSSNCNVFLRYFRNGLMTGTNQPSDGRIYLDTMFSRSYRVHESTNILDHMPKRPPAGNHKNFGTAGTIDGFSKKISTTVRYEANGGNGEIAAFLLNLGPVGQLDNLLGRVLVRELPASVWNGVTLENQEVGTGDGAETGFNLPWSRLDSAVIKVAGVTKTEGTDYELFPFYNNQVYRKHDWHDMFSAVIDFNMDSEAMAKSLFTPRDHSSGDIRMKDNDWITLDLGESKKWSFGAISFKHDVAISSYNVQAATVEISNDNVEWTTVANNIAIANTVDAFNWNDFDSVPDTAFRYMRITVTNGSTHLRLLEIGFQVKGAQIRFSSPPPSGDAITADITIKDYIPKSEANLLDISGPTFTFGHENP